MAESKLAKFIVDDVFFWLKDERRSQLEDQMRRNYDAFRGRYNSDTLKRWRSTEGNDWRSKVFVRFTKQRVVAGYSSIMGLTLQGGKIPWDMNPRAYPENYQGLQLPEIEAKRRNNAMKKIIKDDLDAANADRAFMTSVLEGTLYGWSWLHAPILRPKISIQPKFSVPGLEGLYIPPELAIRYGRFSLENTRELQPRVENPAIWSVFWDLEQPDVNKGQAIILRDMMSKGRFADLKQERGFDKAAIDSILAQFSSSGNQDEGPDGSEELDDSMGPIMEAFSRNKRVIPTFLYYGRVPVKYLEEYAKGRGSKTEIEGLNQVLQADHREAEIVCVVAKGKGETQVISKPILNPFPYRPLKIAKHEELPNEAAGVGVAENGEDSQMIINGLTRAMLDNKALASNLLIGVNPAGMAPGQDLTLYPGKQYKSFEGVDDVRKALSFFAPPDITGNTPALIEMFRDFMDDETGVSRNQTGQVTDSKRTAFELSQVAEAANKLTGTIIRNKDEGHIEPIITGFYHYQMLANPDESIKGDFTATATGYQSFKDKAVRGKNLLQLLQFSISNQFTAQFTKVLPFLREIAKTADLDPDDYYPSDDELANAADMMRLGLPALSGGQTEGEVEQIGRQ